jgi:GTP-binding protein YchF
MSYIFIFKSVRAFEDEDITHVENNIDPIRDIEVIETELLLADLSSIEKRLISVAKKAKMGDKDAIVENEVLQKVLDGLNNGIMARFIDLSDEEKIVLKQFHLLTAKPVLYVANVNEDNSDKHLLEKIQAYATKQKSKVVPICAKLESEMMDFSEEDKKSFLVESGFGDTGLGQIIINGYSLLGLITFFTVGEQEARAWSVPQNSPAPVAAGAIHTDFEKHFIKAEVVSYNDFIDNNGIAGSKEIGKLRLEGKEYTVKDGDVIHFKTGA